MNRLGVCAAALILASPRAAAPAPIGQVMEVQASLSSFELICENATVRLDFYAPDVLRVRAAPDGDFSDPTGSVLLSDWTLPSPSVELTDEGDTYLIDSGALVIAISKNPFRMEATAPDGSTLWRETCPGLDLAEETTLSLERSPDEHFYGGGAQHGQFDLRDSTIAVGILGSGAYALGDCPNPVPLFLSSRGYGVFRNTFEPAGKAATYSFADPIRTTHHGNRFDAFFFHGDFRTILNRYTQLTGRPPLLPRWALGYGHAECYRLDYGATSYAIEDARRWREARMPGDWLIINDQYNCGYDALDETVAGCAELGFRIGLWTSDGLPQQSAELATGVRAYKLDGAWTLLNPRNDPKHALMDCAAASWEGFERGTIDRPFGLTIGSWAGSQRYFPLWTGDQSGLMSWIRWTITTVLGAGLSGLPYLTADLGGYSHGQQEYAHAVYLRDLQWKCYSPLIFGIRGRQPFQSPEPYFSLVRAALERRQRLIPYLYTYCRQTHDTGWPMIRPLVFEFPDDPRLVNESSEFLCGDWLLVAPAADGVPRDWSRDLRRDVVLPEGIWYELDAPTQAHVGPATLHEFPAPLDRMPVFVRGGAILPQQPLQLHDRPCDPESLVIEFFPHGATEFDLYEDDGSTRDYLNGVCSRMLIECAEYGSGTILRFGAPRGLRRVSSRTHVAMVHTMRETACITQNGRIVPQYPTLEELAGADVGWVRESDGEAVRIVYRHDGSATEFVLSPSCEQLPRFRLEVTPDSVAVGATVVLQLRSDPSDSFIARVEFFAGGTPIGSDETVPFELRWVPTVSGHQRVSARVWTDSGLPMSSDVVSVMVAPPPCARLVPLPSLVHGNAPVLFRGCAEQGGAVEVVALTGRLERRLELDAGGQALWDGRDESGRSVSAGVYFYRGLTSGRVTARGRLVIVR